jgi:hypothetical protein
MQMCIIYSVYVRFIDRTLQALYASNKLGNLNTLRNNPCVIDMVFFQGQDNTT